MVKLTRAQGAIEYGVCSRDLIYVIFVDYSGFDHASDNVIPHKICLNGITRCDGRMLTDVQRKVI